ncbi:hypothetical protein [Pseudomonas syringae group genomosp. 3]|uniref:hypothetical protein n=1 Tax=Pseudomonas syringae TaxID=317 RepID=UPI0035C8D403
MGDPISGDAILDWLVHNAYHIELKGESMRRCAKKRRQGLQTKNVICWASTACTSERSVERVSK